METHAGSLQLIDGHGWRGVVLVSLGAVGIVSDRYGIVSPRVVAFVAVAPNSGKTTAAIGLARHLSNAGVPVAPVKAVTVVHEDDDIAFKSADPLRWGFMHNLAAARRRFEPWNNPVTVILDSRGGTRGELFVLGQSYGPVTVSGSDRVDVGLMTAEQARACHDAVRTTIRFALDSDQEVVIVEGAGGVGMLEPAHDLSNIVLPRALDAAVVFVSNIQSSPGPAQIDLQVTRCREWGLDVRGAVLNQANGMVGASLFLPKTVAALGAIGETPDLDDYDASPAQLEYLYERSARAVACSGLVEAFSAGWR